MSYFCQEKTEKATLQLLHTTKLVKFQLLLA